MSLDFSFREFEYIPQGRTIFVYAPRLLHHDSNHHEVRVVGVAHGKESKVGITSDSSSLVISTENLTSGTYELSIRSLRDADDNPIISVPISTKLRIQKISGAIPRDFRVLRVLHLAVGPLDTTRLRPEEEPPEGTYVLDVIKALNPHLRTVQILAFNGSGEERSYREILDGIAQRRLEKFGPLHESLWHRTESGSDDDEYAVAIWPKLDHDYCNYDKFTTTSSPSVTSDVPPHLSSFQRPKENLITAVKGLGANVNHHIDLPYVTTRLTKKQIEIVAQNEDVDSILSHPSVFTPAADPVGYPADFVGAIQPLSLSETLKVSNAIDAHAIGAVGTGVRVGVWELDQPAFEAALKDNVWVQKFREITPATTHAKTPEEDVPHFCYVSAIIKTRPETLGYHGFAPQCDLYLANTRGDVEDAEQALLWAVKKMDCTVVNASIRIDPNFEADVAHIDRLIDWVSTTPPWPLVVSVAGNNDIKDRPQTRTNHTFYNGFIVGAHDADGANMWSGSLWQNPQSNGLIHDRELPDIAACGLGMTVLISRGFLGGTSFASPAVAGTAALLHQINGVLRSSPEAVRAIIYASVGRRVGHTDGRGPGWWDEIQRSTVVGPWPDLKDGAGMLDTLSAVKIAQNQVQPLQTPSNPPKQCGWFTVALGPTQMFSAANPYTFTIGTPDAREPVTMKVAIAWNSRTSGVPGSPPARGTYTSVLKQRYNLAVHTSGTEDGTAYSSSFDNNYEIAQWPAISGANYTVYIEFERDDDPATGDNVTWVGVAWQSFIGGGKSL
ncbi:peptidase S8/S53 domain-containing protein [Clohesyomyces aquaticus]|uniref:Peptidase S8/S53 domain-containing protein n=1 Tax=Clohesyomyces aquaticus TaxID=1231657 RepID=A0A1Y2A0T2_9PLEO|nr:peptidase S8/S53 domain-containing protein [Clohesyomyces aquaticus]